ncbi:2543_t:CDS:2 [Entrophospora sp. SA101]|nr:2542_t:CDS:2 [Entrophospora sp. SA101]CAJ0638683.1 2543_t:CDS:2 [Entrophospora sp. SA101]
MIFPFYLNSHKMLSVPAASSERLFSDASNHISAKHALLFPDLANQLKAIELRWNFFGVTRLDNSDSANSEEDFEEMDPYFDEEFENITMNYYFNY